MFFSLFGQLDAQKSHMHVIVSCVQSSSSCILLQISSFVNVFQYVMLFNSELKRRLKAEKKAAEKEAKIKEQPVQEICTDEENLDPNVRFIFLWPCA